MPSREREPTAVEEWSVDTIEDLSSALDALEARLERREWERVRQRRARLVAEELLMNALAHGRREGATPLAYLALMADGALRMRHAGPEFDIANAPLPAVEPTSLGGDGLRLIRHYATSLQWTRVGDENVTLVKI